MDNAALCGQVKKVHIVKIEMYAYQDMIIIALLQESALAVGI